MTGPLTPLYQIVTITNKVKQNSIVMIAYGFCTILVVFGCLQTTDLGVYAVAGVSLIGSFIVALCYHLPFSAIYIGLPWYSFFPEIGKSVLSLGIQSAICFFICNILPLKLSWSAWFFEAIISSCLGLIANIFLVLNKAERTILMQKCLKKFKRKK